MMARWPFLGCRGRSSQRRVAARPAASTMAWALRRVPSARAAPCASILHTSAASKDKPGGACVSSQRAALDAYTRPSPGTCSAPAKPVRRAGSASANCCAVRREARMPWSCRRACLRSASAMSSWLAAIHIVPHPVWAQAGSASFMRAPQRFQVSMDALLSASSAGLPSMATRCPMPDCVAPPKRPSTTRTVMPACAN
ncbi:hypothetical protein D3C71_1543870 [compost metagenome]